MAGIELLTNVKEISQNGYKLMLRLWETTRFAEGVIPRLAAAYGERIRFNGGSDPSIRITVTSAKTDRSVLSEMEAFFDIALQDAREN